VSAVFESRGGTRESECDEQSKQAEHSRLRRVGTLRQAVGVACEFRNADASPDLSEKQYSEKQTGG
jgi:hypothetical protein